jgi:hypothetical protein
MSMEQCQELRQVLASGLVIMDRSSLLARLDCWRSSINDLVALDRSGQQQLRSSSGDEYRPERVPRVVSADLPRKSRLELLAFNLITRTHVEGNAATIMRQQGLDEATLYSKNRALPRCSRM